MTTRGGEAVGPRERLLHELRTPLSVIKGSIEVLHRHGDELDGERRRGLLERALSNVDELAAAINSMDLASKPRRARLEQIELIRAGAGLEAEVTLEVNGELRRGRGRSEGFGVPAALATVKATLLALGPELADGVAVEEVDIISCGPEQVAAVVLSRRGGRLAGSALVDGDHAGSLCRATLQALNRGLGS